MYQQFYLRLKRVFELSGVQHTNKNNEQAIFFSNYPQSEIEIKKFYSISVYLS
jgi:hypothetical protein